MPAILRHQHGASLSLAEDFIDRARLVETEVALSALMEDVCRALGFRHYALIHHTDLRGATPGIINLNNYPVSWAERFIAERLYREDPVIHACLRRNTGFVWDELPHLIPLSSRQRAILAQAAGQGLGEGMTVPACVPGECSGSCSLAAPRDSSLLRRFFLAGELVGAFAFEAARRLAHGTAGSVPRQTMLTPRQRDCSVLAGQGKTDWEIAQILGLRYKTVVHYLTAARERYGVATRQQLVVCALLDGEISLIELSGRQYGKPSG